MLTPREQCTLGQPCTVLDVARRHHGHDTDADENNMEIEAEESDWSGEGSSESMSSDEEDIVYRSRAPSLPLALLVGDSNAVGYCETQQASLHQALSTHFNITLVAKSGAKWCNLSGDTHDTLTEFTQAAQQKQSSRDTSRRELEGERLPSDRRGFGH